MKSKNTNQFFLLASAIAGFMALSGSSFAQQKPDDQAKSKKTITIHVTKEVDGNTIVIDTTVVTDGDFDVDAFLDEKGIRNDMPEGLSNIDEDIVMRHPGEEEFNLSESDDNLPDTIVIDNDREIVFNDRFDMPAPPPPHPGMDFDYNFNMPQEFSHMERPQFEDILQGMFRSFGLEDVMPFGEMKQVVVKKKHNGKKVIITFEDRDGEKSERNHGNRKEERVIIYNNGDQSRAPQHEERVIIDRNPGENVIIHRNVKKTENGNQVIINAEVDKPVPVKKEKKVIIIREEKTK